MKLIVFVLICACGALCQDNPPFACNLKVFQPEERKQHVKLTREIMSAIVHHQESEQGYTFQIDEARVSLLELAEWVGREKKCCPFFDFQIASNGSPEGKLSLTLSGRPGVKKFILAEFHGLLPAGM